MNPLLIGELTEMSSFNRRSCDCPAGHSSPCPALQDHAEVVSIIHTDLIEIKMTLQDNRKTVDAMLEILTAWSQAKDFIKTVQLLADIAKWFVVLGATVGAILYFFKK